MTVSELSWMDRGACRGLGLASFHPTRGDLHGLHSALAVCSECTVALECLTHALRILPRYDSGVWGGTHPEERRKLRKARCGVCGTPLELRDVARQRVAGADVRKMTCLPCRVRIQAREAALRAKRRWAPPWLVN